MAATSSPASAGNNRLLSEPPPSVAEARETSSSGPPLSLATARAALLQLRATMTSADFESAINGVMDADVTTASESEISVAESHDDDGDMETSASSDGSTVDSVKEVVAAVNDQLMGTGAGNIGSVNSAGSDVTGNTHSTNDEWHTVQRKSHGKKRKHDSRSSNSSNVSATGSGIANASESSTLKKSRVDGTHLVYLKGQGPGFDIVKEANRNPLEFGRRLTHLVGAVSEVKLLTDCLRITCFNDKQKATIMQLTDWYGKPVSVTEPWGRAPVGNRSPSTLRGIIFDVAVTLTDSDIQSETKAKSARRIIKWVNGVQTTTCSVILTFVEALPDFVHIGFQRFKVKPFVPQPMRCMKCQRFGHIASKCRRQVRCVRCGEGHDLEGCPIKEDATKATCVNCGGAHSAAYRGCSKYAEVSQALKVSVNQKISYRDALVKVKSGVLQRTRGDEIGPLDTSTPMPAAAPPAPRRPAAVQPPVRRELFEPPADEVRGDAPGATAVAEPVREVKQPQKSGYISYSMKDYIKQITHYLLYTLTIMEGLKPTSDVVEVRRNLTNIAGRVFGVHGDSPCLTPNCQKC